MGSTRLPGKVLLPLNGHTVIAEVLTRCKRIPGVDEVVCAVPLKYDDRKLADEAAKYCKVYRGDADDVLSRYYKAAAEFKADIIVRVTGDCPLISPELCGAVVATLKESGADYVSNVYPRSVPKGLDCEVFTMALLTRAHSESEDDYEREHVTTWMRRQPDIGRLTVDNFSLDTEYDYKVICAAFGHEPYSNERLSAPRSAQAPLRSAQGA